MSQNITKIITVNREPTGGQISAFEVVHLTTQDDKEFLDYCRQNIPQTADNQIEEVEQEEVDLGQSQGRKSPQPKNHQQIVKDHLSQTKIGSFRQTPQQRAFTPLVQKFQSSKNNSNSSNNFQLVPLQGREKRNSIGFLNDGQSYPSKETKDDEQILEVVENSSEISERVQQEFQKYPLVPAGQQIDAYQQELNPLYQKIRCKVPPKCGSFTQIKQLQVEIDNTHLQIIHQMLQGNRYLNYSQQNSNNDDVQQDRSRSPNQVQTAKNQINLKNPTSSQKNSPIRPVSINNRNSPINQQNGFQTPNQVTPSTGPPKFQITNSINSGSIISKIKQAENVFSNNNSSGGLDGYYENNDSQRDVPNYESQRGRTSSPNQSAQQHFQTKGNYNFKVSQSFSIGAIQSSHEQVETDQSNSQYNLGRENFQLQKSNSGSNSSQLNHNNQSLPRMYGNSPLQLQVIGRKASQEKIAQATEEKSSQNNNSKGELQSVDLKKSQQQQQNFQDRIKSKVPSQNQSDSNNPNNNVNQTTLFPDIKPTIIVIVRDLQQFRVHLEQKKFFQLNKYQANSENISEISPNGNSNQYQSNGRETGGANFIRNSKLKPEIPSSNIVKQFTHIVETQLSLEHLSHISQEHILLKRIYVPTAETFDLYGDKNIPQIKEYLPNFFESLENLLFTVNEIQKQKEKSNFSIIYDAFFRKVTSFQGFNEFPKLLVISQQSLEDVQISLKPYVDEILILGENEQEPEQTGGNTQVLGPISPNQTQNRFFLTHGKNSIYGQQDQNKQIIPILRLSHDGNIYNDQNPFNQYVPSCRTATPANIVLCGNSTFDNAQYQEIISIGNNTGNRSPQTSSERRNFSPQSISPDTQQSSGFQILETPNQLQQISVLPLQTRENNTLAQNYQGDNDTTPATPSYQIKSKTPNTTFFSHGQKAKQDRISNIFGRQLAIVTDKQFLQTTNYHFKQNGESRADEDQRDELFNNTDASFFQNETSRMFEFNASRDLTPISKNALSPLSRENFQKSFNNNGTGEISANSTGIQFFTGKFSSFRATQNQNLKQFYKTPLYSHRISDPVSYNNKNNQSAHNPRFRDGNYDEQNFFEKSKGLSQIANDPIYREDLIQKFIGKFHLKAFKIINDYINRNTIDQQTKEENENNFSEYLKLCHIDNRLFEIDLSQTIFPVNTLNQLDFIFNDILFTTVGVIQQYYNLTRKLKDFIFIALMKLFISDGDLDWENLTIEQLYSEQIYWSQFSFFKNYIIDRQWTKEVKVRFIMNLVNQTSNQLINIQQLKVLFFENIPQKNKDLSRLFNYLYNEETQRQFGMMPSNQFQEIIEKQFFIQIQTIVEAFIVL